MPCSCGNTTCPCGIPCYCLEESCKCPACEIALHRFCKICEKPLITDMQIDKETCSCFVREITPLLNKDNPNVFEKQDIPKCGTGNISMPVGYFSYGKLITNVMIPVPFLSFPQLINQRPISLMLPPSIEKDSGNMSPSPISDIDLVTPLLPGKDSGISPTAEPYQLDKSKGQANCHALSYISSTGAQNTEISYKGTVPSIALQSANERLIEHMFQNTRLETEVSAAVQGAQSEAVCSVATSGKNHDCLQNGTVACGGEKSVSNGEVWEITNFGSPNKLQSNTQITPEYLGFLNIASNLKPQFNKSNAESSKENENQQNGNPSCDLKNKRNEKTDPIPLYIDDSTTQKMRELLNSIKH